MSYITGLTDSHIQNLIARNEPDGVAGLYACKTILNEHRPACTGELAFYGKALNPSNDADIWSSVLGNGTASYSTRVLTLTAVAGSAITCRCVIPTTYPYNSNYLEFDCRFQGWTVGAGATEGLTAFLGFANSFAGDYTVNKAGFRLKADGHTYLYTANASPGTEVLLSNQGLGRDLQAGDICSVRLDRVEGNSNINVTRWYVNGQKQYESLTYPVANMYAGIGIYEAAEATDNSTLRVSYIGFKGVP